MERFRRRRGDDRGTVALEFALILPIFLLLVYGGLSFGLAMSTKSVVTQAAAEGARSAVSSSSATCAAYKTTASNQAKLALNSALGAAALTNGWAQVTPTAGNANGGACVDGVTGDIVTVTVTYAYGAHPTIPALPGLGSVLPTNIQAVYSVEVS